MLDIKKFKRLIKRRQEEKAKDLKELQEQLKSKLSDDEIEEIEDKDADYFMTQVEQEDGEMYIDENVDEAENSKDEDNTINEKTESSYLKPAFFNENQKDRIFLPNKTEETIKNTTKASFRRQRQLTNKFNTKALLQIDSRWNSIPKFGEPLDEKEHFKRIYNFDGAMKGIRRSFMPTLKSKRHPQLEKIEAYFRDCNPDCIPRTPLMKIPPIYEIDRGSYINRFNQIKNIVEGYLPDNNDVTKTDKMYDSRNNINYDYSKVSKSYQNVNSSGNK